MHSDPDPTMYPGVNPLLSSADTESTIEALSKVMTQLG